MMRIYLYPFPLKKPISILLLIVLPILGFSQIDKLSDTKNINAASSKCIKNKSQFFIQNVGQIKDQNNNKNHEVLFSLHVKNNNIGIKKNGFSYTTFEGTHNVNFGKNKFEKKQVKKTSQNDSIFFHRIDVEFLNSNPNCKVVALDQCSEFYNFSNTTNFASNAIAYCFKKIVITDIYPNIDVEFITSNTVAFKYNFIIKPGADISKIKLKYVGALNAEIVNGTIQMQLKNKLLIEKIPASWIAENHQPVNVNYTVETNNTSELIVGFNANYNLQNTLVIDPTTNIDWSTYYGGEEDEYIYDMVIDSANNAVFVGATNSTYNIHTTGAYQTYLYNSFDAFIVKFSPTGTLLWATYFGGDAHDFGYGICTDKLGNLAITGYTYSALNISTSGSFNPTFSNSATYGTDAFISKFTFNGAIVWSTYYGDVEWDYGTDIESDSLNNLYITGYTSSTAGIATTGSFQSSLTSATGSETDGFIVKFDKSGSRIWGTYFGTSDFEELYNIHIAKGGYLYIAGASTSATGMASAGSYQLSSKGNWEAVLAKFNLNGNRIWSTYFGGKSAEFAYMVKTDLSGTVYLVGSTYSDSFISTSGSELQNYQGDKDGFLAKFSSSGNRIWGTYIGYTNYDNVGGLAIEKSGSIYILGYTRNSAKIVTANAYQSVLDGSSDLFISKYFATGKLHWATYFGGGDYDDYGSITVDKKNDFYICGNTESDDSISTVGSLQEYRDYYNDGFLSKFVGCKGEISVFGNNKEIFNNQTIISTNDSTKFGLLFLGDKRKFKIKNMDENPLQISTIKLTGLDSTQFAISNIPSSINSKDSAYFYVTFNPSKMGIANAKINIYNSDCDEEIFSFSIQARKDTTIFYIDASKADNSLNGLSWNNAKKDITAAEKIAISGDQIWVKSGTYYPVADASYNAVAPGSRLKTFRLKMGVHLYGGFAGNESSINQRNISQNPSTLSGLLVKTPQPYHLIICADNASGKLIVDGFNIETAQTNNVASSQTIGSTTFSDFNGAGILIVDRSNASTEYYFNHCVIKSCKSDFGNGGGAYINNAAKVYFNSSIFINNTSFNNGGGLYNSNSELYVQNSTFYNGVATNGGAIYTFSNINKITNSTFVSNRFTGINAGGAINAAFPNPSIEIYNSIFYQNFGSSATIVGADIAFNSSANNAIIKNSFLQLANAATYSAGGLNAAVCTNNNYGNSNPFFKSATNVPGPDGLYFTPDDGYNLLYTSLARGFGNNSNTTSLDIMDSTRIRETNVDAGAYEFFAPEIEILGNGVVIANNKSNPVISDSTDLGKIFNNTIFRFKIQNLGASNLLLYSTSLAGSDASSFTIVSKPNFVASNSFNYIYIKSNASSFGIKNANLEIVNSDENESNFSFAIRAEIIPFCDSTSPFISAIGLHKSAVKMTSNGYECFCTSDNKLLLMLKTAGTSAVIADTGVSIKIGNPATVLYNHGTGFVGNNLPYVTVNRTWNVNPTSQPQKPVVVRFPFTNTDLSNINATLVAAGYLGVPARDNLTFYKVTNSSKPTHSTPNNLLIGDVVLITKGNSASNSNFIWKNIDANNWLTEFTVNGFSGGGGGGGADGSIPLNANGVKLFAQLVNNHSVDINWKINVVDVKEIILQKKNQLNNEFNLLTKVTATNNYKDELVTQNSYYRLLVINKNGDSIFSNIAYVNKSAAINRTKIIPNPNTGNFTVETNSELTVKNISVLDLAGKIISNHNSANKTISLHPNVANGMYLLMIEFENGEKEVLRFLKE